MTENTFAEEGNEIINDSKLLFLYYDSVHTSGIFSKTLKTWRGKLDIDKKYAKFVPFMTQQEEDCLNSQQTSGKEGFINTMADSIVHDKMK